MLPKCSTPGCHKRAELECDHPVEARLAEPPVPKVGDSRLHNQHRRTFYVRRVNEITREVTIAHERGALQVVSWDDWFRKASATCDRPICAKCAVEVGPGLHHCPAHARLRRTEP